MRRAIVAVIVYSLKSRLIVWRNARCLRLCDRLSSPMSVMLRQLQIRGNEINKGCRYSLPAEVKTDSVESCKIPEAL